LVGRWPPLARSPELESGLGCSQLHTGFRHTFAKLYLLNGGDVVSLQRILGHTTLDMVRCYVTLSDADLVARRRAASPADRLVHSGR
jgi:integrase/recombinase XerD